MLNERCPEGVERIALVGTPCQISGLRAIQKFPWERRDTLPSKVTLAIGLFCTRAVDPEMRVRVVAAEDVNLAALSKMDIRGDRLVAASAGAEELMNKPVKDFHQ